MSNNELLKATAKAFEEMRYVDGNFLAENNVSADDAHAWCAQMAAIVSAYVRAPKAIQNTILAAGVAPTDQLAAIIWAQGILDFSTRKARERLDALDITKF